MGIFDRIKKRIAYHELDKQIERREAEHAHVMQLGDLSPNTFDGHKRRYHYKDVAVWVRWEYGGQYGKSCQSIGIKVGDALELLPAKGNHQEPGSVAVCWKGTEIGHMKTTRMRDMVHSWQAAQLPVLAFASHVGGEEKLLIEFAFYGSPPHNK